MSINACRAYFKLKGLKADDLAGGVRSFVLNFGEDGTNAIEKIVNSISSNSKSLEAWYSLDGRRLEGKPSQRGIYVNNGRKVVIK